VYVDVVLVKRILLNSLKVVFFINRKVDLGNHSSSFLHCNCV
jgi:hypothetical protein